MIGFLTRSILSKHGGMAENWPVAGGVVTQLSTSNQIGLVAQRGTVAATRPEGTVWRSWAHYHCASSRPRGSAVGVDSLLPPEVNWQASPYCITNTFSIQLLVISRRR